MNKPKYVIIKELILEDIKNKEPNQPISSERELAIQFESSRMTVRRAVEELVEEGYLYRDKNKGTFISDEKLRRKVMPLLIEEAQQEDTSYNILYFDIKSRDDDIVEHLNLRYDDLYIRVIRLVLTRNIPTSVEEIYIAKNNITDAQLKNVTEVLDIDEHIREGTMTQVFNPMIVPIQYANLLKMKINEPIIRVDSLISQKTGLPYMFVRSYYHPKRRKIEITM